MIRRLFTLGVVLALVAATAGTAVLFLYPRTSAPTSADAVTLFVGGKGERLETALRLMEEGVATHLIIPNGTAQTWPQANRLCRGPTSFKVYCPKPDTETTRGEARAIADLATRQGWRHVVMVTSTYHVTRAHLLLSRCFSGAIDTIGADPGLTVPRHAARIGHEWAGLGEAWLVNRGC